MPFACILLFFIFFVVVHLFVHLFVSFRFDFVVAVVVVVVLAAVTAKKCNRNKYGFGWSEVAARLYRCYGFHLLCIDMYVCMYSCMCMCMSMYGCIYIFPCGRILVLQWLAGWQPLNVLFCTVLYCTVLFCSIRLCLVVVVKLLHL